MIVCVRGGLSFSRIKEDWRVEEIWGGRRFRVLHDLTKTLVMSEISLIISFT
jgi:hypothetical protein